MKFKITVLSFVSIVILNLSPVFAGEWTPVVTGVNTIFYSIWGSSSTDVFAVGEIILGSPNIYHYDGSTWSTMQFRSCPNNNCVYPPFYAVWGTSEPDVFVLWGSSIIHYDGIDWSTLYSANIYPWEPGVELYDIWGTSSSNVYAVGSTLHGVPFGSAPTMPIIVHYNGEEWTQGYIIGLPDAEATGIWGSSEDDIFVLVAGIAGSRIMHYAGKSWSVQKRLPSTYLIGVWGSSASDVFAVGAQVIENEPNVGVIWHYDGRQWTQMDTGQNMVNIVLNAVWGSSGENVYVGGGTEEGTFYPEPPSYIFHYDGSTWSAMASPQVYIESIWGSSATDIYAAEHDQYYDGIILHYDGTDGGIAE
jgi:hypothetical protein